MILPADSGTDIAVEWMESLFRVREVRSEHVGLEPCYSTRDSSLVSTGHPDT